jgi:hypothetical protein
MRWVWSGINGLYNDFSMEIHSYLNDNHNLVRKYSLLLFVFIVLTGGGQRPQAYCSFQQPDDDIVRQWEEKSGNEAGGPVKLYPNAEKTPRGTRHVFTGNFISRNCELIFLDLL